MEKLLCCILQQATRIIQVDGATDCCANSSESTPLTKSPIATTTKKPTRRRRVGKTSTTKHAEIVIQFDGANDSESEEEEEEEDYDNIPVAGIGAGGDGDLDDELGEV